MDSRVNQAPAISKLSEIVSNQREASLNPQLIETAKKYKEALSKFDSLGDSQAIKQNFYQDLENLKKENV